MPSQKRSIRDFFAPIHRSSPLQDRSSSTQSAPNGRAESSSRDRPSVEATPRSNSLARQRQRPHPSPTSSPPAYPAIVRSAKTPQATPIDERPPTTSQSSGNSTVTSKRIVSNGEPMVLDSDSESDESLKDLDWPSKKKPILLPKSTMMSRPQVPAQDDELRKPPPRQKQDKAFKNFLQITQRSAEAERQIAEVKADLEKPLVEETTSAGQEITEDDLSNAMRNGDDPEKAKRLHLAIQRTNALQMDNVFHLFRDDWVTLSLKDSPFPMDGLPNHAWTSIFQGPSTRNQAFISGFAQQAFRFQQLPEELALWMIEQVCTSQSEALNDRYLEILGEHHSHLQSLLDKTRLFSIFVSIGTETQHLNPQTRITPFFEPEFNDKRPLPLSLVSICRLLQTAARWLQSEARSHALFTLFHVCMDDSVGSDIDVLHHVQDAVEALMCNVSDNKELASMLSDNVQLLLTRIDDPILQRQLVASLPAKSPLTAYFQRYLAFAFLLYPVPIDTPLDGAELPQLICKHLDRSPDFRITREMSYVALAANFELLDIAIGPGLLTVPYKPLLSPPPSQHDDFTPPGRLTSEEKAFNKTVDDLTHRLEIISDSIKDSGVADLTRMQAKDCCERLYRRLQNSVRIGGRRKVNVFGENPRLNFDTSAFKRLFQGKKTTTVDGAQGDD